MFTFNVGSSSQLELAFVMSVSIEAAATFHTRITDPFDGTYCQLKFNRKYTTTLGPILYIPTYINGYTYKVIEEEALYNFSKVTDVIINEGYFKILNSAFAYCQNLKSVQIPNSVLTIESNVFVGSKQVVLIFTSGNNKIAITNINSIRTIIYYRTNTMTISVFCYPLIPFYASNSNLIILPEETNIDFRPISEIGDESAITSYGEILNNMLIKKTTTKENKIKPSCQKSKSQLNLLLITPMAIKM